MADIRPDWLIPDWPAPANVRAAFTTRSGGVSTGPYASLNLGDHVNDEPDHVQTNRGRLSAAIQAQPVFMQQVHGIQVVTLTAEHHLDAPTIADACVTSSVGVACTVMVADCLPVLFTSRDGRLVAAAHAGWRGLCDGVLEAVVHKIQRHRQFQHGHLAAKTVTNDLLAWLGPAIGPSAFEVGEEVRQAFLHASKDPAETANLFAPKPMGKYLANLPGLARERLMAAGVSALFGNDGGQEWCTVSNPSRYFSHRRDVPKMGNSGRMAACIWRIS